MSTVRRLPVSLEEQRRARLAALHTEMQAVGDEQVVTDTPPHDDPPPGDATLETLVETELKAQLRRHSGDSRLMNLSIMNAIKFLAVRAKLPVAFGSDLDE